MDPSGDELAGVVDLFGALAGAELRRALAELAYKRGETREPESFDGAVDAAVDSYHLVAYEPGSGERLLVPGPVAFPTLPAGAEDLPHILEVEERSVNRASVGRAAEERFRVETARAVAEGDRERAEWLLDVSYQLEAWAPVELDTARERLDAALG